MLSGKLLRVLALVCAAVVGIGLCGATWPIEIDGKKADAPWYALSDSPEKLAVGDALYVGNENGGLWLCVRDTENLCFVNRLQSEALLYRKVGEKLEGGANLHCTANALSLLGKGHRGDPGKGGLR